MWKSTMPPMVSITWVLGALLMTDSPGVADSESPPSQTRSGFAGLNAGRVVVVAAAPERVLQAHAQAIDEERVTHVVDAVGEERGDVAFGADRLALRGLP